MQFQPGGLSWPHSRDQGIVKPKELFQQLFLPDISLGVFGASCALDKSGFKICQCFLCEFNR